MAEPFKIILYGSPECPELKTPVNRTSKTFCPRLKRDISGNGTPVCFYLTKRNRCSFEGRFRKDECLLVPYLED